jgi:hypothetical protein
LVLVVLAPQLAVQQVLFVEQVCLLLLVLVVALVVRLAMQRWLAKEVGLAVAQFKELLLLVLVK